LRTQKRDEYQLVNYILKFKGFQALSALVAAAVASSKLFDCAIVNVGSDACDKDAPGLTDAYIDAASMEPVRIIMVWLAFLLLRCGYAYGGKDEITALENVRQDMADGQLDGVRDLRALRQQDGDLDDHEAQDLDDDEIDAAVQAARKKIGVQHRRGGLLPSLLIYDLVVAAYCAGSYGHTIFSHGFSPNDATAPKFWTTIFFARTTYGLLAFPFLIFNVPVLGPALTKCKATGYDMRGVLCAKLSGGQITKVFQLRHEKAAAAKARAYQPRRETTAAPLAEDLV
jgi:hypothetical protein